MAAPIQSREIPGAGGVQVHEVIESAQEVFERLMREQGILEKPEDFTGADITALQRRVNAEVHHAIPALPLHVVVLIDHAGTATNSPGWFEAHLTVNHQERLGELTYEKGIR